MIAVNTTFYVHDTLEEHFLEWIRNNYLPSAQEAGFLSPMVYRLLIEPQGGMSGYAVQVIAKDLESAKSWHDNEAASLRGLICDEHGEKILFFTTYMERVDL